MAIEVEIRRCGASWACFYQGQQVTRAQNSYEKAAISAFVVERRLRTVTRRCMCCGADFASEGIGNRMCDQCLEGARQMAV